MVCAIVQDTIMCKYVNHLVLCQQLELKTLKSIAVMCKKLCVLVSALFKLQLLTYYKMAWI